MGRRMRHGGWWESGHGRQVSGGRWPDGASPPPDRQGVGAGQVGRRRGSYQGAWRGAVRGWWRPCSMVASRAGRQRRDDRRRGRGILELKSLAL